MNFQAPALERLGVPDGADERTIRRAYARELKLIDQAADPAGFQSLREAYEEALFWARVSVQEAASEPGADAAPEAAPEVQPAQAPLSLAKDDDSVRQVQRQVEIDPQAQSGEVFAEFMQRCAGIADERAEVAPAPWERELRASLADERLFDIAVRELFEVRVAHLLANGWQPGHEALLVAAIAVFGWANDRRRVRSLGAAGHHLDAAIDERTMFDEQEGLEWMRQARLVARLRDPSDPDTRELLEDLPTLETMAVRYPAWLGLVTDVERLAAWRERSDQIPGLRRKLAYKRKAATPESYENQTSGGFNWGWLIFVVLMILGKVGIGSWTDRNPVASAPSSYSQGTDAPREVSDFIERGEKQLNANDHERAAASFGQAIALDGSSAQAYAGRALAYIFMNDPARALPDLDKAAALDGANMFVYQGRGMLALRDDRNGDAIAAFTRALELDPRHIFTLYQRAGAYQRDGRNAEALADTDAIIQFAPRHPGAYQLRARIYLAQGDRAKAARQATALLAADPGNPFAFVTAALIHRRLGDINEAIAVVERGRAVTPSAMLHLARADLRPASELAGRKGDIDAALALDPLFEQALIMRALLELDAERYGNAVNAYATAIGAVSATDPVRSTLLLGRGEANLRLGEHARANADFDAAREVSTTPRQLNTMCWRLATRNVALQKALSACDAAIAQAPTMAAAFDSRAFVLLRMERYRESVAAYNAALKLDNRMGASQYGRGIAKRRLGDMRGGDADLKAALEIEGNIAQQFARYGVEP